LTHITTNQEADPGGESESGGRSWSGGEGERGDDNHYIYVRNRRRKTLLETCCFLGF